MTRTVLPPGTMGDRWPAGLEIRFSTNPYVPRKPPTKWQMWRWMYWDSESEKPQPEERMYAMADGSVILSQWTYNRLVAEFKPNMMGMIKL